MDMQIQRTDLWTHLGKEREGFVFLNIILFTNLWLHWVLVAVRGLSLAVASAGHSPGGICRFLIVVASPVRSPSSRVAGSVVVLHGLSCSAACDIFPDQALNSCPLRWRASVVAQMVKVVQG